jgi:uncharacterized membrane protein YccC
VFLALLERNRRVGKQQRNQEAYKLKLRHAADVLKTRQNNLKQAEIQQEAKFAQEKQDFDQHRKQAEIQEEAKFAQEKQDFDQQRRELLSEVDHMTCPPQTGPS